MRSARVPIAVLATLLVLAAVVLVAARVPRRERLRTEVQPASVAYDDGRRHTATLWRERSLLGVVGLGEPRVSVVLGADPGGTYGHVVALEATGSDPTTATVRWEPDAAVIDYASGHEVVVPARWFTGGR